MTQHTRKCAVVFAVAVVLFPPTECRGAKDADAEAIRAMFGAINLDYPGLEKVKAALATDDLPSAETAYLEFWRTRKDRRILWNPHFRPRNLASRTGSPSDFFLDPAPRTISWRDREKLKSRIYTGNAWADFDAPTQWDLLEMADLMLKDRLVHIRMGNFLPPMDMGNPWKWGIVTNNDPYTNAFLHRHYFMPVLAQAYWLTGEDKYVAKLVSLWTDWIRRASGAQKNQGLAPMYQAFIHPSTLEMILGSPTLKPRAFCLIVAHIPKVPIPWLTRGPRGGNQTFGQVNGILSIATALPEFKQSDGWRKTAMGYLTKSSSGLTYPDGGFAETTFMYATGTASALLTCADNLKATGVTVPKALTSGTEKWGEYFVYNARPDWLLPWTGHGGRVDACDLLGQLAMMHPHRKDFLYYATKGAKGEPPKQASAWFPYAGYSSMRDRYTTDANYLFFDVGPCGTFHRNANKLMVIVAAHGRALLEDQGIHTYTPKLPEFRTLCDYNYGHNTVLVDGRSQPIREEIATAPQSNPWTSTDVLDFNEGDYSGPYVPTNYTGSGAGGPVTDVVHRRSVVFVKPDYWIITDRLLPKSADQPAAEHTYEQLFHFIPCQTKQDPRTLEVYSATPDQPNLALIPIRDAKLSVEIAKGRREPYPQGWYFRGGKPSQNPAPIPAPCVIYKKKGAPTAIFQTMLSNEGWPDGAPQSGTARRTG